MSNRFALGVEAAGIQVRISGTGAGLPAPVPAALAWVVREGTTNVLRHSETTQRSVAVRPADSSVVLTMENDGVVDHRQPSAGTGPVGLRERLAAAGRI
jgi:two-component system, NarL family, sensor histidine kinase DesK